MGEREKAVITAGIRRRRAAANAGSRLAVDGSSDRGESAGLMG